MRPDRPEREEGGREDRGEQGRGEKKREEGGEERRKERVHIPVRRSGRSGGGACTGELPRRWLRRVREEEESKRGAA